jgi:hypothetical protein
VVDAGQAQVGPAMVGQRRDWALLGLGFLLAIALAPGRTLGDRLRRVCQTMLWEAVAGILIMVVLFITRDVLITVLGLP